MIEGVLSPMGGANSGFGHMIDSERQRRKFSHEVELKAKNIKFKTPEHQLTCCDNVQLLSCDWTVIYHWLGEELNINQEIRQNVKSQNIKQSRPTRHVNINTTNNISSDTSALRNIWATCSSPGKILWMPGSAPPTPQRSVQPLVDPFVCRQHERPQSRRRCWRLTYGAAQSG